MFDLLGVTETKSGTFGLWCSHHGKWWNETGHKNCSQLLLALRHWDYLCFNCGVGGSCILLKLTKVNAYRKNLIKQFEFFNSIQINQNQWHNLKKPLKLAKINESIYSLDSSRLLQSEYIFLTFIDCKFSQGILHFTTDF